MRLLGYMVTYKEWPDTWQSGRLLRECFEEWWPCLDGLLFYDDRSTDQTASWLRSYASTTPNIAVHVRPIENLSFIEHEGLFREDAWRLLEQEFAPVEGDWVMTLDADEVIRSPYPEYVKELCERIDRDGYDSLEFHFHEVWTPIDTSPMVRMDGFWAETNGIRACKWKPGMKFKDRKMASGSLPDGLERLRHTTEIDILHYGYARQEDRERKYQRYRGRPGHNPKHISSILKRPTLAPLPPLG